MFRIRQQQMEALEQAADEPFVEQLVEYLRKNYPDVGVRLPAGEQILKEIAPELLRVLIRNGLARARGYGFLWESTLTAFVAIMLEVAPNFDEFPLFHQILVSPGLGNRELRLDELIEITSDGDWEQAAERYDPDAWLTVS